MLAYLDHRALQRLRHAHAGAARAHHDDAQLLDRLGRLLLHPQRAQHCAHAQGQTRTAAACGEVSSSHV